MKSNTSNTQASNINQVITKAYVDQFRNDNEIIKSDLGTNFYDESNDLVKNFQDNDFNDNKLTKIDSITIVREPSSDNELAKKQYVDDSIGDGTVLRFNQTLENYIKVSVGNDTYTLNKYNKIQLTGTTINKTGNTGVGVLTSWRIVCFDKNNNDKQSNFIKSTKTDSPTGDSDSGATFLPPIGNSFLNTETSSNNNGIMFSLAG